MLNHKREDPKNSPLNILVNLNGKGTMARGFRHILWVLYTTIFWFINFLFFKKKSDNNSCLIGKTAIVTGGNSGIGYALSTLLASRGCKVIIADVVNAEKATKCIIETTDNKNVTWKHLDLASLSSVRAFAKEIHEEESKIDILINNGGIGVSKTPITQDNLNTVMHVNFFGPFLLTHLLVDRLKAASSSRVVFTSSIQAFFSNLTSENMNQMLNPTDFSVEDVPTMYHLYCNSKLCNMFAAQEFAEKLYKYKIRVNSADPGVVNTPLFLSGDSFNNWYMKALHTIRFLKIILFIVGENNIDGAQTAFHLASSRSIEHLTGQNCFRCKQFIKHKILEDRDFCSGLWRRTEKLVKLNSEEML